ncbi:brain protein I3 [Hyalella azteca]|uniref:Membrane protein BRI3 n=1 Tax=Hyalella azteca TaxID=294128 RepID=A0A8B7NPF0_HYAAZ|nr:brain protein I3 [Hyalella azteca]
MSKAGQDLPPPYAATQAPLGFSGQPQGYPAQPQGYPPQPQGYPPQAYPPQQQTVYVQQPQGASVHVVQPTSTTTTAYVIPAAAVGTCPACRVGILTNEFTCCGIFLAICLFPLGFICCLMMMERRCSNCRAVYG